MGKNASSRIEWGWLDKSGRSFNGGDSYPWAEGQPSLSWMEGQQFQNGTPMPPKPIAGRYCVSLTTYHDTGYEWDDKLCTNNEELVAVCKVQKGTFYFYLY